MPNSAFVGTVIAGFVVGFAPAGVVACEVNTQFLLYFKSKEISQLINGISNGLKNLPKYLNGTAILMSSNSVLLTCNFSC